MKLTSLLLAAFVSLTAAAPAHASLITWDLNNVTGTGEQVTGFFDYNPGTDSISDWSIQAAGILNVSFISGTPDTSSVGGGEAIFKDVQGGGMFTTTYTLNLKSISENDAIFSGMSPIGLTDSAIIKSNFLGSTNVPLMGSLVNPNAISAVPLPASLPMSLAGMLGFGMFAAFRRRTTP